MKPVRIIIIVVALLLAACGDNRRQALPMQQSIDSLKMWYERMQGDSMEAVNRRIGSFLEQHKNDRSDDIRLLRAEWLNAQGVWHAAIKGRPDSGIVYTELAIKEMQGLRGVDEQRMLAMANRADFYRQTGQLDYCADGYLQALKTADSIGLDEQRKIPLMLGIGTAYSFMGDYQHSRLWWKRLETFLPQMSKGDQFIYYNNRGNDCYFQQQYEEARDYFIQATQLVRDNKDKQWDYYTALSNLGEIYTCLGKADSARILIDHCEPFFRSVDYAPFLYYLETQKIELLMLEKRYDEALRMVRDNEGSDVAIPAAKVLRLKAIEMLMNRIGDHKAAYDTRRQWQQLNDSIQNVKGQMQMNAQLMEYEHDKQLVEQQRVIDRERMQGRMAWVLLALAVLTIILLVVLAHFLRRQQHIRNMTVRQQIMSLRMENTRNRITPHFIYNALTHEMLAQMQGREVDLTLLTQLLRRGVEQADNLKTTLAAELEFVDYYVAVEGKQIAGNFTYTKEIDAKVEPDKVFLPAMTIQIFVENAVKHGLRRQGGHLTVAASRKQDATLIEVTDDGQGLKPSYSEHTGMKVVRQTIQLLNENNQQQISFGISNVLEGGCRSWLLLPDAFDYNMATV